jgi:PAS domain S-box-containing protein
MIKNITSTFKSLSIGWKIGLGYSFVVVLIGLVGGSGFWALQTVIAGSSVTQLTQNSRDNFRSAQIYFVEFNAYEKQGNQAMQDDASESVHGALGLCLSNLKNIDLRRIASPDFGEIIQTAMDAVIGYKKSFQGIVVSKNEQRQQEKEIRRKSAELSALIASGEYLIQDMEIAGEQLILNVNVFTSIKSDQNWQAFEYSYAKMEEALSRWGEKVDHSTLLNSVYTQIKSFLRLYDGVIRQYHRETHKEDQYQNQIQNYQMTLDHVFDDLIAKATESMIQIQNFSIIVVAVSLVAAISLGVSFATVVTNRNILKPISRLKETTQKLSRGDLYVAIDTQGSDEIGELSKSFSEMRDALVKQIDAVRRSELLFRTIFENAPVLIDSFGSDGRCLLWNHECERLLGWTIDEINEADDFFALIYSEPDERSKAKELRRTKPDARFREWNLRTKDGKVLVIMSASFEISENTTINIGYDITERKKAEMELLSSEEKFALAFNSAVVGMLITDAHTGTIIETNDAFLNMIEFRKEDVVGSTTLDVGLVKTTAEREKTLEACLLKGKPRELEYKTVSGKNIILELKMAPIRLGDNECVLSILSDITEKKQTQELIIQSEKMISVGGLAAGMAHEINNPLGIIQQAAENIGRRVSAELAANRKAAQSLGVSLDTIQQYFKKREIIELIDDIHEASRRASRIITNVMQFSRRGSFKDIQLADPRELIERAIDLAVSDYDLKKKYDFRNIEIRREYEEDVPRITVIAAEIEQVILNLLKNSAQAMYDGNMDGGRPLIILRIKSGGEYIQIEVEDNGPGVNEEVRKRVFEPFFTTKAIGKGTGLGLSVCYSIITNNHKGVLMLESTIGAGTTFIIRLPAGSNSMELQQTSMEGKQ